MKSVCPLKWFVSTLKRESRIRINPVFMLTWPNILRGEIKAIFQSLFSLHSIWWQLEKYRISLALSYGCLTINSMVIKDLPWLQHHRQLGPVQHGKGPPCKLVRSCQKKQTNQHELSSHNVFKNRNRKFTCNHRRKDQNACSIIFAERKLPIFHHSVLWSVKCYPQDIISCCLYLLFASWPQH